MSDANKTQAKTSPGAPAQSGEAPVPATGKSRQHLRVRLVACGCAVALLLVLVAILRPAGSTAARDADAPASDSASVESIAAEAPAAQITDAEGTCSRPAEGAGIVALVQADAAYDSGDFPRARDLYLDFLLSGGDFGPGGDLVASWAHGRLALSMAKVARKSTVALLDEPPLLFRGAER